MIPTKQQQRFFNICKEISYSSKGVGGKRGNNFKIGAIVVRNNRIISSGVNSYKTSPRLLRFYEFPYFHAEAKAISSLEDASGADVYCVRIRKDGSLGDCCPCFRCLQFMGYNDINRVLFSTGDQEKQYDKLQIRRSCYGSKNW